MAGERIHIGSVLGSPCNAAMFHNESLMLYTITDKHLLRGADSKVAFQVREIHETLAQSMVTTLAGFDSGFHLSSLSNEAFRESLDTCGRLPLALWFAGATVMQYCDNRDQSKQDA